MNHVYITQIPHGKPLQARPFPTSLAMFWCRLSLDVLQAKTAWGCHGYNSFCLGHSSAPISDYRSRLAFSCIMIIKVFPIFGNILIYLLQRWVRGNLHKIFCSMIKCAYIILKVQKKWERHSNNKCVLQYLLHKGTKITHINHPYLHLYYNSACSVWKNVKFINTSSQPVSLLMTHYFESSYISFHFLW